MIGTDDCNLIRGLIAHRKMFRIGARGIAIELVPISYSDTWRVIVERASMDMICEDVDVCEDEDATVLECYPDKDRKYCLLFNLDNYSTVRRLP